MNKIDDIGNKVAQMMYVPPTDGIAAAVKKSFESAWDKADKMRQTFDDDLATYQSLLQLESLQANQKNYFDQKKQRAWDTLLRKNRWSVYETQQQESLKTHYSYLWWIYACLAFVYILSVVFTSKLSWFRRFALVLLTIFLPQLVWLVFWVLTRVYNWIMNLVPTNVYK